MFVDNVISNGVHEPSLLRLDPDGKLELDERGSFFLNSTLTSRKTKTEKTSKAYVNSLSENNGNEKDSSTVLNDEDHEYDNK